MITHLGRDGRDFIFVYILSISCLSGYLLEILIMTLENSTPFMQVMITSHVRVDMCGL